MDIRSAQATDNLVLNCMVAQTRIELPWLVFITPFGAPLEVAESFLRFFSKGFNVITWQSRGVLDDDQRPTDENFYDLVQQVKDFHTVVTSVTKQPVFLVGYCSGAGVALGASLRYPNTIRKLILVHGEYLLLDSKENCTTFSLEVDRILSMVHSNLEFSEKIFEKMHANKVVEQGDIPEGINAPYGNLQSLRALAANYISYKNTNFSELAKVVNHDTVLFTGGKDKQTNVASTQKIASFMENAKVIIDPDADHYGILRENSSTMISVWNELITA